METHDRSVALRFTAAVTYFLQFDRPPQEVWEVWDAVDDNLAARVRNVLL